MRVFALLVLASLTLAPSAHAGITVSVWSPGVLYFDPYDPGYMPAPRPDYVWVPGYYDEYGYFIPGYWAPVAPNPGYSWAPGYWAGRSYHEGYWRSPAPVGRAWVDGYYVRGRYIHPRHVRETEVVHVQERVHRRVQNHEQVPPQGHAAPPPKKHKPAKH